MRCMADTFWVCVVGTQAVASDGYLLRNAYRKTGVCVCVNACMYIHIKVNVSMHMYICIYTCVITYMHIPIRMYVYIHICLGRCVA